MMFNCLVHGLSNGYECKECHEVKMIGSQAQYKRFFGNKEQKMTREEAIKHCLNSLANKKIEGTDIPANQLVGMLEALGLLKFEEAEKKKISLFEITANNVYWPAANLYQPDAKNLIKFNAKYGVVRLEEWPEGLVLWVDGKIVYKSWSPGS